MIDKRVIGKIYILFGVLMLVSSCNNNNRREINPEITTERIEEQRIEIVPDTVSRGDVFEGIMPVPDDESTEIKVRLTLYPDQTYNEYLEYSNRQGETTFSEGRYSREGDILIIEPQGGNRKYYRMDGNSLYSLDDSRQPVNESAGGYVLRNNSEVEIAEPYPTPL